MALYHFAVRNAGRLDDPEGTELPNDAAAYRHAIKVICELQHGAETTWSGWTMEVREGSRQVWQVPFISVQRRPEEPTDRPA